ncbi:MAG: hypothetical protein KC900_09980 [Candidatus Omnitrophica bacterium]|nr:hypothetical protein [Candidatus Omnitrophota bacterium]
MRLKVNKNQSPKPLAGDLYRSFQQLLDLRFELKPELGPAKKVRYFTLEYICVLVFLICRWIEVNIPDAVNAVMVTDEFLVLIEKRLFDRMIRDEKGQVQVYMQLVNERCTEYRELAGHDLNALGLRRMAAVVAQRIRSDHKKIEGFELLIGELLDRLVRYDETKK